MKRFTLIATLLSFLAVSLLAEEIKYNDSWEKQGFSVMENRSGGVTLNFSVTSFDMGTQTINGEDMTNLGLTGSFVPNDAGAPDVPGVSCFIAIPQGAQATFTILSNRTELFQNIDLIPAPALPLESDNRPLEFIKNPDIYSNNAFYPTQPVLLSETTSIRGVDVVQIGVTPFLYNPVTRELILYRDIQIEITFEGGNGQYGDERLRSIWWEPILSDHILNYDILPAIDPNRYHATGQRGTGCEYLIITPNGSDFIQWANTIKVFRNEQGVLTNVVTLADIGGNTTYQIENYINNAYNNWDIPPAAVLLLGDYGTTADNTIISPIYNNYCASDNIYADVDSNHLPDITFARITARNASELETMVTKFINYEENPPTDPGFYAHPVTALGWQTERWFQICSESIGGFWKNVQGKDPVRINAIYQGTPGAIWSTAPNTSTVVNYFGPNGLGYIPQMPSTLGSWTGGNASMVNTALNDGAFMMQHRDHGNETRWGEPYYTTSHIGTLANTELTFIMSINCLTGKYNWGGECFAEKFHRHTKNGLNSGALGIIAASESSYSFVNDTYVWGVIDNLWPEFMPFQGSTPTPRGVLPAFGNSAGKYFLQQSSWPYNTNNKQVTYHLFHHHGDAFMTVYSEVPQDITVVHDTLHPAGSTQFVVTADQGSFIALSKSGLIMGVADATGGPDTISIPPLTDGDVFKVTVTKQNYFRYSKDVLVTDDFLIAGFSASTTEPCAGTTVDYTDQSSGEITTWEWYFAGGIPETSGDRDPVGILYENIGAYGVTLIVSDGVNSDTSIMADYINVNETMLVELTVEASQEEICDGTEVTFTASPVNGGDDPVYQWKINGGNVGENTAVFMTDALYNEDIITCEVTSSLACTENNPATSNDIVMTVYEILPVSATIEASQNPACEGQEVVFTATSENGGENPSYQWRINAQFVGDDSPEFASNEIEEGDEVVCVVTSSEMCTSGSPAASNTITMNITPSVIVDVSIEASANDVCEGTEITFTASPVNGGDTPQYVWFVNGDEAGDNSNSFSTHELLNGDEVRCELWSSEPCAINPANSNDISMTIYPLPQATEITAGPVSVDLYGSTESEYTSETAMYADSYVWALTPSVAGTITGDGTTAVVTWTESFTGAAEILVNGNNECGEGPSSGPYAIEVFNSLSIGENDAIKIGILPNPNDGSFKLQLNSSENSPVNIRVVNAHGKTLVEEQHIRAGKGFSKTYNLKGLEEGIYFIIVDHQGSTYTEKFIIRK